MAMSDQERSAAYQQRKRQKAADLRARLEDLHDYAKKTNDAELVDIARDLMELAP